MAAAATRSKTEVYLLGSTLTELTGNKLPSLRQVRYWFVFTSPSSTKTNYPTVIGCYSRKLAILYQMARIQMMDPRNCITKVERTFKEWRLLKKNKGRQSVTQQANEARWPFRHLGHSVSIQQIFCKFPTRPSQIWWNLHRICIGVWEHGLQKFTAIFIVVYFWRNFKDVWGNPVYRDSSTALD